MFNTKGADCNIVYMHMFLLKINGMIHSSIHFLCHASAWQHAPWIGHQSITFFMGFYIYRNQEWRHHQSKQKYFNTGSRTSSQQKSFTGLKFVVLHYKCIFDKNISSDLLGLIIKLFMQITSVQRALYISDKLMRQI